MDNLLHLLTRKVRNIIIDLNLTNTRDHYETSNFWEKNNFSEKKEPFVLSKLGSVFAVMISRISQFVQT